MGHRLIMPVIGFVLVLLPHVLVADGQWAHAAEGADLVSRWSLPALAVNAPFSGESITYLPDGRLLIADEDQESIWSVDPQNGVVRPWLARPSFGMRPSEVRYDSHNRVVYVAGRTGASGVGQPQYLVLDEHGTYLDRWTLPARDDMWITNDSANRIALTPDGLLAWLISSPPSEPGQSRSKIATADRYGQRTLGSRCSELYTALSADQNDLFYLKRDLPGRQGYEPGYQVDRVDGQCREAGAFYRYNGTHPFWSDNVGLASWPAPNSVFLATDLTVNVLTRAGQQQYLTFVPQLCPDCRIFSLAPGTDGGFAVLSADKVAGASAVPAQAVQFDRDGHPTIRTIFRPAQTPVDWTSGRLTVDESDQVHVLYPDSDRLVSFASSGRIERELPAPSWARDIDAAGNLIAMKGSAGSKGSIRLLGEDGELIWHRDCECDTTAALTIGQSGVTIANAVQPHLVQLSGPQGTEVNVTSPHNAAEWLPLDMSSFGERTFVLDGIEERIEVIDPRSQVVEYLDVPRGTFRIDVSPEGRIGAITRDGKIMVRNESRWQEVDTSMIADAESIVPRDLSWTSTGNLTILDAHQPSIIQIKLASSDEARPVAPPDVAAGEGMCRVKGNKVAAPNRVALGEAVQIQLSLDIKCPASQRPPLDVLVVLSGGLRGGDATEPHDYQSAAWQAAERLIEGLDLSRDRVAIYQHGYGQLSDFTHDQAQLRAAIRRVGQYFSPFLPASANDFDGLGWAFERLEKQRRAGSQQVLVQIDKSLLITQRDGTDVAARSRKQGVQVLLVYRPYDGRLSPGEWQRLRTMVAVDGDVINLDDVLSSDALLQRILSFNRAQTVRDVEVWDEVSSSVDLLSGSASPRAAEEEAHVYWRMDGLPTEGVTLTVSVRPNRLGRIPTNHMAVADYTEPNGVRRRFRFPIPFVEVIAPTATVSPTELPTNTPRPTQEVVSTPSVTVTVATPSIPVAIYLPILLRERCNPSIRRADVVLAIDASTSMLDVSESGRTKLDAAIGAASTFLDELHLGHDQAGIVTFNSVATIAAPLTKDRAQLNRALSNITPAQQTCIVCAIDMGWQELRSARHDLSHVAVLILLTDGRSNPQPASESVAIAAAAKAAKVLIYAIGLGDDLDEGALREVASSPDSYFHAPSAQDLAGIYRGIAVDMPCPASAFWAGR
jgi:hypothetical protein